MNKRILLQVLFFVITSSLMAQESSWLKKAYVGALQVGAIPNGECYHFQNDIFPLVGVRAAFPILSGTLHSRLMHDLQNPGAHLWWEKDLSILGLNLGYLSRPVTVINRPESVSAMGNFEPPAKAVIPGPAFGAMTTVNLHRINNELMFGLYQTGKDSVEFNYGIQQNINWSIFQKIGVSGYQANYKSQKGESVNGIAVNAELQKISLMFFKGVDVNDIITYSGFAYYGLAENAGTFLCLLNQDEEWTKIELGIFKIISEQIGNITINYLLGAGYDYSETRPSSFNFYVQTWLEK